MNKYENILTFLDKEIVESKKRLSEKIMWKALTTPARKKVNEKK